MEKRKRTNLIGGILLILVGAWFLAMQFFPQLGEWINIELSWPWIIIGVGIFLLVLGLLVGEPGLAVPAVIVGGIGGLLYYQNTTGDWDSWAYAWTLIPGFVGLGILLAGLLGGTLRKDLSGGLTLIVISAVLFVIFASFLGGMTVLGDYWPVLFILLGVWILLTAIFRKR
jgi:hypothetical protein